MDINNIITYTLIFIVFLIIVYAFVIQKKIYWNKKLALAKSKEAQEEQESINHDVHISELSESSESSKSLGESHEQQLVSYEVPTIVTVLEPASNKISFIGKPEETSLQVVDLQKKKCNISLADMQVGEFQRNIIVDRERHCGDYDIGVKREAKQSSQSFSNDFFSFRDNINEMSHQNDLALRVSQLYLEPNIDVANKIESQTIREVFDETIKEPCIRTKRFDNIVNTEYFTDCGAEGAITTNDMWMYDNEKENNGGEVSKNLYAYDENNRNMSFILP